MRNFAQKSKNKFVVADFVCPLPEQLKIFKPNFIVWMDTIKKGRFKSMNKLFKKPKKYNLRLTEKKLDINLYKFLINYLDINGKITIQQCKCLEDINPGITDIEVYLKNVF